MRQPLKGLLFERVYKKCTYNHVLVLSLSIHTYSLQTHMQISFIDLSTLKSSSVKFACQAKVDKIEPVKVNVHIQYTDKQKNIVVCMDQNYEDVEIPMNIFGVSEEYLEPGMEISVFKHEDKIIKVNLPSSLLATLRKK